MKGIGADQSPSGVTITGRVATLTLDRGADHGDTITVSYTPPATGAVQDTSGNEAAALTDQAVANNTPDTTAPVLSHAAVNQTTLTLTYDEALDAGSKPPASAYTVKGIGADQSPSGVTITGTVVKLALDRGVSHGDPTSVGDTITVSYTPPATGAVRDTSGNEAIALIDQAVANDTTENFQATTLSPYPLVGIGSTWGCDDSNFIGGCRYRMGNNTFEYEGKTYRVRWFIIQVRDPTRPPNVFVSLDRPWPDHLRQNATLSLGEARLSLADAVFAHDGGRTAAWREQRDVDHPARAPHRQIPVGLTWPSSGASDASGHQPPSADAPTVTGVAIVSDPGNDDTYGLGDVIRLQVTFSEAVDVTGAPTLDIDMDPADWGTKRAVYADGSGTTTLTFTHTVVEPNYSTRGIAVLANTLELNGGTIQSTAGGTDADLSHTGLAHDANHKVNWGQSGGASGS